MALVALRTLVGMMVPVAQMAFVALVAVNFCQHLSTFDSFVPF